MWKEGMQPSIWSDSVVALLKEAMPQENLRSPEADSRQIDSRWKAAERVFLRWVGWVGEAASQLVGRWSSQELLGDRRGQHCLLWSH